MTRGPLALIPSKVFFLRLEEIGCFRGLTVRDLYLDDSDGYSNLPGGFLFLVVLDSAE